MGQPDGDPTGPEPPHPMRPEGGPVVSIMPPEPDSDTPPLASLRGVADMMSKSHDAFTVNVGFLAEYIAAQHEPPVTCAECRDRERDLSFPCLTYESALSAAFAWLLKVIDERG